MLTSDGRNVSIQRGATAALCREARRWETHTARRISHRKPQETISKPRAKTAGIIAFHGEQPLIFLEVRMKGNLVIVCRDQDAQAFDHLMADYGAYQVRLSSTAWYLKLEVTPEHVQDDILAKLGKYTTHYIFGADSVIYNTVDSEAASALDALFSE
jgi:hypothetical protein